jgi:hypothetical protein
LLSGRNFVLMISDASPGCVPAALTAEASFTSGASTACGAASDGPAGTLPPDVPITTAAATAAAPTAATLTLGQENQRFGRTTVATGSSIAVCSAVRARS